MEREAKVKSMATLFGEVGVEEIGDVNLRFTTSRDSHKQGRCEKSSFRLPDIGKLHLSTI